MDVSYFHFYSIGQVASNKKIGSSSVEVIPVEYNFMVDGEINSGIDESTHKGTDSNGNEYTVRAKTSNTIKCTWLPFKSNRLTPPDVRRGERVMIYRMADMDKFYWCSMGLDDNLRKLETVVFAISNTKLESDSELTADNTYWVEFSTHDKHITLHTTKSDMEPFAYTFQFDTKGGKVTLTDDIGNYLSLISKERRWTVMNRDSTFFMIDKRNAYIYAPDEIGVTTKLLSMACEVLTIDASKEITIKTPKLTGVIGNTNLTTDMVYTGNIEQTGDYDMTGNLDITGNINQTGNYTVSGNITASGTITAPSGVFATTLTVMGINVGTHIHGYTDDGNPSTTTPPVA